MSAPTEERGPSPPTQAGARGSRLDSWKEIAAYLGRDVRTVQRWERREGLPVHRQQHDKLGSVYAFRHEIDAWRAARSRRLEEPPGDTASGPDALASSEPEIRADSGVLTGPAAVSIRPAATTSVCGGRHCRHRCHRSRRLADLPPDRNASQWAAPGDQVDRRPAVREPLGRLHAGVLRCRADRGGHRPPGATEDAAGRFTNVCDEPAGTGKCRSRQSRGSWMSTAWWRAVSGAKAGGCAFRSN